MNTENSKTDKSHIFRLNLSGKLDFKNCNKNIALAIYYMCKTLNLHITTINLKYLLQLEMPHGSYSVSDVQDYFENIIKKDETITNNIPEQIYVNKSKTGLFLT